MKQLFTTCMLLFAFSMSVIANNATVHFNIKNFKGSIYVHDPGWVYDLTKKKVNVLQLDAHQSASYSINIDQPTYLIFYLADQDFRYSLFLTPGDELFLTIDFKQKNNQFKVTGKGSNNNQPEIFALTYMDLLPFKGDKDPERVTAALKKQYLLNKNILSNYIKVNKPSAAFIKNAMLNLKYFVPDNYYEFNHNNNFFKPKEQLTKWRKVQDSIFSTVNLSNDEALNAYNYIQLVDNVVLREREALQMERKDNSMSTNEQWLNADLTYHQKKPDSRLQPGGFDQQVLDQYFSGKAAEYAYIHTLKWKFARTDYPALVSIFNHFKNEYPHSAYIKAFKTPIAEIVNKQRQALNSKTVFVKKNGTPLKTIKDVLALTKGKAALIDMWGTWCGPCREEIEKNSLKLETYFKGKNVNFIYVANDDMEREQEWKKQIAYFQIEGLQILANPALTSDMMGKVHSTSYPTYIIVKKDGSYKKSINAYPVNIQAMIKEIDAANL